MSIFIYRALQNDTNPLTFFTLPQISMYFVGIFCDGLTKSSETVEWKPNLNSLCC